jgi:hypothetical protein
MAATVSTFTHLLLLIILVLKWIIRQLTELILTWNSPLTQQQQRHQQQQQQQAAAAQQSELSRAGYKRAATRCLLLLLLLINISADRERCKLRLPHDGW